MISFLRASCTVIGLGCIFFGAFFVFDGQYNAGVWAILAGTLLVFIGESITEVEYYDDDDDKDNFA